jgi:DNA-binding NarL/FixJ family response regulator
MSRKALQINVSERTRQLIRSESNRRKSGAGYKKRLQIIYHSSLGLENKEIAELLECRVSTVRRWRARWQNSEAMILGLEKDHN